LNKPKPSFRGYYNDTSRSTGFGISSLAGGTIPNKPSPIKKRKKKSKNKRNKKKQQVQVKYVQRPQPQQQPKFRVI